MNQTGAVTNPTGQLLQIMENSSLPSTSPASDSIVFQLQNPFIWFPGTLTVYAGLMLDMQYVFDHGGLGTPTAYNPYFNQNPIPGTGPYEITQVSEPNYVKFQQNPNYWGDNLSQQYLAQYPYLDPGHAKTIIVYYKTDDLTRYSDLTDNAAQVVTIQQPDWNLVTSNPALAYYQYPRSAMTFPYWV